MLTAINKTTSRRPTRKPGRHLELARSASRHRAVSRNPRPGRRARKVPMSSDPMMLRTGCPDGTLWASGGTLRTHGQPMSGCFAVRCAARQRVEQSDGQRRRGLEYAACVPRIRVGGHRPRRGRAATSPVGRRRSAVVLLHGHPRTHTTWHAVAPLLAKRHGRVPGPQGLWPFHALPETQPDHAQSSKRAMAGDGGGLDAAHGARAFRSSGARPWSAGRFPRCHGPPACRNASGADGRSSRP